MTALLSVLFVLCWASGFIGAKLGVSAPVTTVLMWRFVPLALLLLPVAVARRRTWPMRALGRQVLVGLLSQSGYLLAVFTAIRLGVDTGTTALIDGIQPLAAAVLVGPLLGLRVTGRQWFGLAVGLLGAALVTSADAAASSQVAWWAYAVPFAGMLSLIAATFVQRRSRTTVPPLPALAIQCTTSTVVFTGIAMATGTATPPTRFDFWVAMAWLIGLSTFGGYGLYWALLRRIDVTRLNTLMFLMAPVTAVWGALMFGERFGPVTGAGLALGLIAVTVVTGRPSGVRATETCERRRIAVSPPPMRKSMTTVTSPGCEQGSPR